MKDNFFLRCDNCGRFHSGEPGSSGVMLYSGYPPVPDREITRCFACTRKYGPLRAQAGIRGNQAWVVPPRSESALEPIDD